MRRKIYIVGDSTLSKFNDKSYFYPRYGYGTQLEYYFNEEVEIINLALSGRSSKSFLSEENYSFLKQNISFGDFLLIGFGHNNEKDDDVARFTSANKPLSDETSFMYSLYENYIKLARSVGATPILCTPIVRLDMNKDYDGYSAHITNNGNYCQNIIDLGDLVSVLAIDLTTPTKDLFLNISIEEACLHHAITSGKMLEGNLYPNYKAVDKAHLNIYGARYVAYLVCKAIKESECELKKYLVEDIKEPIRDEVLVINKDYTFIPYKCPNLNEYIPVEQFNTESQEWYGTAFGDLGCNALDNSNGFIAKMVDNKFIVGQNGSKLFGKFHASADGFACVFKQIAISDNFKISVKAKVIELSKSKQTSFGLMLRDDIYLNQISERESTMNNYVSAGFLTLNVSTNIIHCRECTTELNMAKNIFDGFYDLGDEAYLEIERLGQVISVKVIYKNKEYSKDYVDFDLVGIDNEYIYLCLYSTCGTIIEFSDIEFINTGTAKEA